MTRAACALLPLLLWACDTTSFPTPAILSVEPTQVPYGDPSVLSVRVAAAVPVLVDYEEQSATSGPAQMTLWIAGREVEIAFAESDGTLVAPVPAALDLGDHDVQVRLADGREAIREDAFSVLPASMFTEGARDGGTGEDGGVDVGSPYVENQDGITGFQINPIQDPVVRGVPFQITIRALGPGASTYQAPVFIRANKGQVATRRAGSFSGGVRREEISLSHPGKVQLMVEDGQGRRGLSNSFRVRPH